jgi:hypothetical protein
MAIPPPTIPPLSASLAPRQEFNSTTMLPMMVTFEYPSHTDMSQRRRLVLAPSGNTVTFTYTSGGAEHSSPPLPIPDDTIRTWQIAIDQHHADQEFALHPVVFLLPVPSGRVTDILAETQISGSDDITPLRPIPESDPPPSSPIHLPGGSEP